MTKLGIPVVAGRRANMTRPTRGFPACHYCGNCGAGCDTASFFCSADHLLPFALEDRQARDPIERRRRAHPDRRRTASRAACSTSIGSTGAERQVLGEGRRGRRELRRLDAHSAQLEVGAASERPRQRLGRDRPLSVRADPAERHRLLPGARRHADAERSRHRRRAHLHAALQPPAGPWARLPARLRRAVLEHRRQHLRRAFRLGSGARLRRRAEDGDQAPASGLVRDPSVRRGAAVRAQPDHGRSRRASIATACRCRASTTGSARTSGR